MTKSLFCKIVAVLGATALVGVVIPVRAASITFSDSNCASFSVSGGNGAYSLSCASLTCSIASSAGVNMSPVGTPTTLTASCNPPATAYTWSAGAGNSGCPGIASSTSTASIAAPNAAVAGCLYQMNATSGALGGTATITLAWSNAPPPLPTCLPLTAATVPSPMTIVGGTVTVNSSCSAPSGTITYAWTRTAAPAGAGAFTPSGVASQGDSLAANTGVSGATYTYQLQACTAPSVCAAAQTISVIVPGSAGTGIVCNGFPSTMEIDLDWETSPQSFHTSDKVPGFKAAGALVVKFTVPAGTQSSLNNPGSLTMGEYGDPPAARYAVLSTTACDFANPAATWGTVVPVKITSTTVSAGFSVNMPQGGVTNLVAGQTYYLNIKNTQVNGTTNTCTAPSGSCNMIINWSKPSGT